MKLASLHIDRFGARAQLGLEELGRELNVIYGPNGAGKTTIIEFIRWMLFGQHDESSGRFLGTTATPARGSMTIDEAAGRRRWERTNQFGADSSLSTHDAWHASRPPSLAVSLQEFDRFFCVSFDRPRSIEELLAAARTEGLQLRYDQRQLDRWQHLTDQISQHRDELNRMPRVTDSAEELRLRREQVQRELDAWHQDRARRRDELQRERQHVAAEEAEQRSLVDRLGGILQGIETAVSTRHQQLSEEHQKWLTARQEAADQRHRKMSELDAQVARWQEILSEVRHRLDYLRNQIGQIGDPAGAVTDAADMRFYLRTLGFRIRDIEQDLGGGFDSETWQDHEADAKYLRGLLGSALNSMRDDVARLCDTVERQQQIHELQDRREELTYLCRCEQELSDLIDALNRRRHQVDREAEFWPSRVFVEAPGQWRADPPPAVHLESAAALNDFRLRHLVDRRESAASRLHAAELDLASRRRELQQIEARLASLDEDSGRTRFEQQIAEIDARRRELEQRETLEHTITSLEQEAQRLRRELGNSDIVDEATSILRRLTGGEYTSISITEEFRCRITYRTGQLYEPMQLSQGIRDQVYLSLGLAIVAAFGRRQVELPLILNDVFVNLDAAATRALSQVLAEFASRGHQVLVFTRHEHIFAWFEHVSARRFTLRQLNRFESSTFIPNTTTYEPQPIRPSVDNPTNPSTIVAERPPIPTDDPTFRWVAEWHRGRPEPVEPQPAAPVVQPPPADQPSVDPPGRDEGDPPKGQRRLGLVHPLSDVPTLDEEFVGLLHQLGVYRVDAFLELDANDAEVQLGSYGITAEIVQRRQREILMMLYVLATPLEAQLLVACGVPDPERLGRADEGVLLRRIETILEQPQAASRFGTADQYSLQRVRGWIQTARVSEYQGPSSRSRTSNDSHRANAQAATHPRRRSSAAHDNGSGNGASATEQRRDTAQVPANRGARFYLETHDPVVDAPSIGPKTAARLHEIDIHTVADLLHADADDVAAQLGEKRISPETVFQWQLQAQLVCRIPNLRGHDAQILVACGIEEPSELATLEASNLLQQVNRVVRSKEGERILRGAKHPDLAEVTAWIEWSENARQLQAA